MIRFILCFFLFTVQLGSVLASPSSQPTSKKAIQKSKPASQKVVQKPSTTTKTSQAESKKIRKLQLALEHAKQKNRKQEAMMHRRFLELRKRVLNPKGGLLDDLSLVSVVSIQKLLGNTKPMEMLFLQGIPRTPTYDALQFSTPYGQKGLGLQLSVQAWNREKKPQMLALWKQQIRSYPGLQLLLRPPVGKAAFRAYRAPYRYLNFLASNEKYLFSLCCHEKVCKFDQTLLKVARHIDQQLSKVKKK